MKKKSKIQGQHGGARPGSGRPPGISTKIVERQEHARDLLDKFGGDATWLWVIQQAKRKKDYRTVADVMKYWTDRAEGKAPQAITGPEGEPVKMEMVVTLVGDRAKPTD